MTLYMKQKISLKWSLFLLMFTSLYSAYSQNDSIDVYRIYATQLYDLHVGRERKLIDSLEDEISNIQLIDDQNDFNFELKFHVLLNDNIINDEIIRVQLDALNRAFKEIDRDKYIDNDNLNIFYELAEVPNFNFCNSLTNSFRSVDSSFNVNPSILDELQKVSPVYNGKGVINVYVVDLGNGFSGFSTLPNTKSGIDAIVIDKTYFGIHDQNYENYNQGKTLIHLIASFLGIYELWDESQPCKDDLVEDTQIHNYANFSPGSEMKNISTCDGNPIENIVNYMDNLPDKYNVMFTKGQVQRLKKICLAKYGRQKYNSAPCNTLVQNRNTNNTEIAIYPNPNSGLLFLSSSKTLKDVEIEIFNFFGHQVHNSQISNIEAGSKIDLNLQNIYSGIYTIRIYSATKLVKQTNFIKN